MNLFCSPLSLLYLCRIARADRVRGWAMTLWKGVYLALWF